MQKADVAKFRRLEESLWIAETRYDPEYMEQILSTDFFEFGCSGRIYRRADTLAAPAREIRARIPLRDFQLQLITEDVVQVTYISEVPYDNKLQICNRSSIWVNTSVGWQLRFHQGTPVSSTERP